MAHKNSLCTNFKRLLSKHGDMVHMHRSFVHKLSYDKQKNLNSIHTESKHFARKQFKNNPYYAEYNNCKNTNEILNLLTKHGESDDIDILSHHIWAIQKLASLEEFKLCWKMFSDLTTTQKYLPLLRTNLYTTMIWLSCQQHLCQPDKVRNDSLRRKKTCDKIFSLLSAIKNKINLEIDCDTITTVISSCCKLQQYGRGEGFFKSVINTENSTFNIELNIDAYNTMLDLYSKSDQMNEAYDLYENIRTLNHVKCDNLTFCILINGAHKHSDIDNAQKLFTESHEYLAPNVPNKNVYCALMNGYASRGNVMKCWELFTQILHNYNENSNVVGYEADVMVFSIMLKALCRLNNNEKLRKKRNKNVRKFKEISVFEGGEMDQLKVEDCWKMIKYIILKMKELNIERNVVIYGLLFHLCGDAFGESNCKFLIAKKFYQQMIDEHVEISSLCFHNFLKVGLCHFNVVEKDIDKKEEFVKWLLTEMKKYNVAISSQTRLTLRENDIDLVDYGQFEMDAKAKKTTQNSKSEKSEN